MSNKDAARNGDLPASQEGADTAPGDAEWGIEPTGAPEDFGFQYETASIEKRRVWDCQEAFLATFRTCRRVDKSAEAIGLTRYAHDNWVRHDTFGYRERLKVAHADWREAHIEGEIDSRIKDPQGNRGSDVLLMFAAKAEDPEKYREQVTVVDTAAIKESLDMLRKLGTARVVDGTARVVEDPPASGDAEAEEPQK